jgi:hypothetical protein
VAERSEGTRRDQAGHDRPEATSRGREFAQRERVAGEEDEGEEQLLRAHGSRDLDDVPHVLLQRSRLKSGCRRDGARATLVTPASGSSWFGSRRRLPARHRPAIAGYRAEEISAGSGSPRARTGVAPRDRFAAGLATPKPGSSAAGVARNRVNRLSVISRLAPDDVVVRSLRSSDRVDVSATGARPVPSRSAKQPLMPKKMFSAMLWSALTGPAKSPIGSSPISSLVSVSAVRAAAW